jgi:hypothetical protein
MTPDSTCNINLINLPLFGRNDSICISSVNGGIGY